MTHIDEEDGECICLKKECPNCYPPSRKAPEDMTHEEIKNEMEKFKREQLPRYWQLMELDYQHLYHPEKLLTKPKK